MPFLLLFWLALAGALAGAPAGVAPPPSAPAAGGVAGRAAARSAPERGGDTDGESATIAGRLASLATEGVRTSRAPAAGCADQRTPPPHAVTSWGAPGGAGASLRSAAVGAARLRAHAAGHAAAAHGGVRPFRATAPPVAG